MRLCLPARMGGGGKAESPPWRGPAGAQRPPHGGGYSASGTRGQSPWRSRTIKGTEAISLPQPQRGTGNGTLARRDAGGRRDGKQSEDKAARAIGAAPPVEAKARPALARQGERQERQRVSPKTPHPQGARSAGKSATLKNPAHLFGPTGPASLCASDRCRQAETPKAARCSNRSGELQIERGAGFPAGATMFPEAKAP